MANEIKNSLNGAGLKVAIAVARFNEVVTDKLLEGALRQLELLGVADKDITVVRVPGAFELPGVCRRLADSKKKYDAVMAMHYEQGVFPMKFLSTEGYAYYWAGLPVVCAAPLHGPAYDIANQNKAIPDSYRKAVFLAADVVGHRREQ